VGDTAMFEIDLSRYRVVDLSLEIIPDGTADRPFRAVRGVLPDGCFKYDITCTHTHVGTHVEVPAHFWDNGPAVSDVPATSFMGPAVLLHITDATPGMALDADYCARRLGGLIGPQDSVICRNESPATLTGKPTDIPYLLPEAAEYLAGFRPRMLGIDTTVGLGHDIPEGRRIHEILMGSGCSFIEFMANLDDLRCDKFYLMALPFKVRGMDSGWCRAIAIEDL
jgi:arylformamidase